MDEEAVAYHEAGHAVIAVWLGGAIQYATMEPHWDDQPRRDGEVVVEWRGRLSSQQQLERELLVALAGPAAELIYQGNEVTSVMLAAWQADWHTAMDLLAGRITDYQARKILLQQIVGKLQRLLDQAPFWSAIAAAADLLLAHGTVDGDAIAEIVAFWITD